MALTYQSLAIACGFAFAVSLLFTLLRIVQFISLYRRGGKQKVAEVVGLICLICSTICITSIFALDKYMSINSLKNMGKKYPFAGGMVTWGRLPENNSKNVVIVLLSAPALWFLKGSYLCVFWTMYQLISRRLRVALICLSVYMVFSLGVVLGTNLLWCRPLYTLWTVNATNTSCATPGLWAITPFSVVFAMTASTDLALLVFAALLVRSVEPQKKVGAIALLFLFTIASMSLISSIVRFVITAHYYTNNINDLKNFAFVSWHLAFWQYLEIIFAVVAYGLTSARHHLRMLASGARRVSKITSGISWSVNSKTTLTRDNRDRYSEYSSDSSKGGIHVTEEIDVEKATLPEFHNPVGRREDWQN